MFRICSLNENQQATFLRNLLIFSVAGAGIEPATS